MCSTDENASNNEEHGTKEGDIPLANQVIEVTHKGAYSRNGKRVGCREPPNDGCVRSANVRSDERQATTNEVQWNLRSYGRGQSRVETRDPASAGRVVMQVNLPVYSMAKKHDAAS